METTSEMESMRIQMAELRDMLDKHVTINDRMIKRAMKDKSQWIKCKYRLIMYICAIMVPYDFFIFREQGFSIFFCITTSILLLTAGVYTYYNIRYLDNCHDIDGDMISIGLDIAKAKKRDSDWVKFAFPAIIPWFIWFSAEAYMISNGYLLPACGLIGFIIGSIIGMRMHMNIQRRYKEIIEYINDIKAIS